MYYIRVENGVINGSGEYPCLSEGFINIEVSQEFYNEFSKNPEKYIYLNEEIVVDPEYIEKEAAKREAQFKKDFFNTSLGWIRRKVSMKTGETKDFLTDLLPVISLGVQSGQTVNLITYRQPDFTQEIVDWESLQDIKQANALFIQECFAQVSIDFTGT